MTTYIYPQNLRASAKLWFWSLKDFTIVAVSVLLSVLALTQTGFLLPLALSAGYAFLTIRAEDTAILDFIRCAARYFLSSQQRFEWRLSA